MVPRLAFPMCDVRDVARAHISAMKSPKAAGEGYSIFLIFVKTNQWRSLKHTSVEEA